jgi:HK97 family phage major capsid protein
MNRETALRLLSFNQQGLLSPDLREKLATIQDRRIAEALSDQDSAAYRCGQFLRATIWSDPEAARWCRSKKLTIVKDTATSPNSAGGVLVPNQVADSILLILEQYGVARREATHWPMTSDHSNVPRATTGFTASWISEGGTPASTQATFDSVGLTTQRLGAFVTCSNELLEDSISALGMWFIVGAAQAFAYAEDECLFNGTGTSATGGHVGVGYLLNDGNHAAGRAQAASGHNTFALLDSVDFGATVAALPARAIANAKIYCSMTCYGQTLVHLASLGGGLVAHIAPDGTLQANFHGLPVVPTSVLPTSSSSITGQLMLCVGDMSQAAAFGSRRELSVRAFTETFAELDKTLIQCTERVDIVAHDLGNNVSSGALVGLFAP